MDKVTLQSLHYGDCFKLAKKTEMETMKGKTFKAGNFSIENGKIMRYVGQGTGNNASGTTYPVLHPNGKPIMVVKFITTDPPKYPLLDNENEDDEIVIRKQRLASVIFTILNG